MRDYIFIEQNIKEIKGLLSSSKKQVYKRLIDQCDSYFLQKLASEHPASSTTFMGLAMANLSLAYLLSEDNRYLKEAKRWIFTCVDYPHWGNAHLVDVDLSAAWILFGIGLSYDWLKDDLNEKEKKRISDKILLQGSRMYDFKIKTEGSGWSTNYWQNHNWINMTGLAAAGYALLGEDDAAEIWVSSAKENFDFVYSVLPEDGSDYEGVVYWRYGAMWLFIYAHLLKEREGVDYFRTCSFLEKTFYYRLYQAAPNLEESMNFGDAHDRRSGHSTAIYYKVASEYKNGHAQKLGNLVRDEFLQKEALSKVKPGILPECFFEMLFFDESVEEEEFDTLPLTAYFEDLGLFTRRSSWDRDATLVTFKCSTPGGKKQWNWLWKLKEEKNYNCFGLSHQHPDNNAFLIHSQGEYIAIDDGYNRNVKASDHNVVLVDGKGYVDEGQNNIWKNYSMDMKGEIENCIIRDDLNYIAGECARVYQKDLNLNSFKRHIINTGKSWYVMLDELKSSDAHHYSWQMFSDKHPEVVNGQYQYRIGRAAFNLYSFSNVPTVHNMTENTVRAVMTTQEPDKFTENHMKGLRITNTDKVKNLIFLSVFLPVEGSFLPSVIKLEAPGVYGVSISDPDKTSRDFIFFSEKDSFTYLNETIEAKIGIIKTADSRIMDVVKLG